MTLSPQDRAEVLRLVAEQLVAEIRTTAGDLAELCVVPLGTASQLVGLSTKQAARLLPVTRTATGKHGVTIAAIRRHIQSNTQPPILKP